MMKKISLIPLFALCLGFTIAGVSCNDGKKGNDEYLEYKEKVSEVLSDNGVSVSDGEEAQSLSVGLRGRSVAPLAATATTNELSQIWNIIDGETEKKQTAVQSYYQETFEMALYVPLILGDAISTTYEAEKFYGVHIKSPSSQWLMTEKDGDVLTTYVYTNTGSEVVYIVFNLDYKSEDDYAFTCYQFNDNYEKRFFVHGDDEGNFLYTRYQNEEEDMCFLLSRKAGASGYMISDSETVLAVMNVMADNFTSYNKTEMASFQNSVDYTVSENEYKASQAKIFPQSLARDFGLLYNVNENENVCYGFGANGEERVEIPDGLTFGQSFTIYDHGGKVKEVVLPSAMTFTDEAKTYADVENGGFEIKLFRVYGDGTLEEQTLEKITVSENNPYFKTVEENLFSADGETLMYLVDSPNKTSLSLDFSRVPLNGVQGLAKRKYFDEITSLEFPLVLKQEPESQEWREYNIFDALLGGMYTDEIRPTVSLQTLTVNGVTDRFELYADWLSASSTVEKLVLKGDFECVLIGDERGIVQSVELASSVAGAEIHDQSVLPSVCIELDIMITEDNQNVSIATFERVKTLTIANGVTSFSCNFDFFREDELDIYLPSSLTSFRLPAMKLNESGNDLQKDDVFGVFGNYRLHLPCAETEFSTYTTEHPNVQTDAPFVKIFSDTNEDSLKSIQENFPVIKLWNEGVKLINYYGNDDKIVLPESVYGLDVVALEFSGEFAAGKTAKTGTIEELCIPLFLKELILSDADMNEKYHFEKITYAGTYNEFSYFSIVLEEPNPDLGILDQFKSRYDLLVCNDKTLSPLDKVYNCYIYSFGEYNLENLFFNYTHETKTYTVSAEFKDTTITGVLNSDGKYETNVTVDGDTYTWIFTHDGVVFEPLAQINMRQFTVTVILPNGERLEEVILDDRV